MADLLLSQEVLKQCTVNGLVVKLPDYQLDPEVYTLVKKQLELIGGKWKAGKTQGFAFKQDPTESLASCIAKIDAPESTTDFLQTSIPIEVYGDEDLAEFKANVERKLQAAQKELIYLQGLIERKEEGGNKDQVLYDTLDDQGQNLEVEQLREMTGRQEKFIDHLQEALKRIEDKTYGICRVTGKLIDKARLCAVPHATLSVEAKKLSNIPDTENSPEKNTKRTIKKPVIGAKEVIMPTVIEKGENTKDWKCKVCGCTDDNCVQCIRLTGSPCHWTEPNLCSACADAVNQSPQNDNEMNFFKQLADAGHVDFSFRIMQKNRNLTINIKPGGTPISLMPMNFTATPEELDKVFFEKIVPAVKEVQGLVTNIDDVKQQASEMPVKVTKSKTNPKPTKKAAPKKTEKKVIEKKKPVKDQPPEMFPE